MWSVAGLLVYSGCLLTLLATCRAGAGDQFPANWSPEPHGYDGPWNTVRVSVTVNFSDTVDLYPGSFGVTYMPMGKQYSDLCPPPHGLLPCPKSDMGGFYKPSFTHPMNRFNAKPVRHPRHVQSPINGLKAWDLNGQSDYFIDRLNLKDTVVYSVDKSFIAGYSELYRTYPNGVKMPQLIGLLDLGSAIGNLSQVDYSKIRSLPNSLAHQLLISTSFGLHIGSVSMRIPGSLWFGGYDQTRVLGPVLSQTLDYVTPGEPYNAALGVNLFDIGISTTHGSSRDQTLNNSGLLSQALTVTLAPSAPYIFLPKAACDALTADLPVTFDEGLGLYLWNEDSPRYTSITNSASYITFTFEDAELHKVPIKVAIQLLQLTLLPPLVKKPTRYFPCSPTTERPALGRAFLQAAFLGVNWRPGTIYGTGYGKLFLAQAPGPNTAQIPEPRTIRRDDNFIQALGSTTWEETWQRVWDSFETQPAHFASQESTSGLSTGARAGIGVGVAAGFLAVTGILLIVWPRRSAKNRSLKNMSLKKRKVQNPPSEGVDSEDAGEKDVDVYAVPQTPQEIGTKPPVGFSGNPAEAYSADHIIYELPSPQKPVELSS